MGSLTPVMQQYLEIKRGYQDTILFFHMGDFYEMFYEDAIEASRILDITLTSRNKGKQDQVPMCGIPCKAASVYVARLINAGKKVAICEQEEAPGDTKGLVARQVTRVITPGLLVDDEHLVSEKANYLMAVASTKAGFGIAFLDISTGDFRTTEVSSHQDLINELARISPSEILSSEKGLIPEGFYVTEVLAIDYERSSSLLSSHFKTVGIDGIGLKEYHNALIASGMILDYVNATQKGIVPHIVRLTYYNPGKYMILDANSKRNLELFEPLTQGTAWSLFKILNHAQTPMGTRRLQDWLTFPLMEPEEINKRLDAVEELTANMTILYGIRDAFKKVLDLERIVARISADRASPRDILGLSQGLEAIPGIREFIASASSQLLKTLWMSLEPMDALVSRINNTLVSDPPHRLGDGDVIGHGVDSELDELRDIKRDSRKWIASLEAQEKEATGINSLKIGYNRVFGYYIEITNTHLARVPETYIRKQTLSNAERFITPELKDYEARLLGAEGAILEIEARIFKELREHIVSLIPGLQQRIDALSCLDALACLAWVAVQNHYARPQVHLGRGMEIRSGRHPVVEKVLKDGEFVPNDGFFDDKSDTVHLITGPNMAGKSTYMRQITLITIMAQMGSFVPAKKASIGIADRIFTRIGALDNLAAGQSTFLVEMSETANILNNATQSSLVILDEIGRGTSTYDGMSIAWAVAEYLNAIKARTFFATHYHELADLARKHKGIKNFHMAIEDEGSKIVFLRELRRGAIGKSYGIHVAKLAGVPDKVIENAEAILASLGRKGKTVKTLPTDIATQLGLFSGIQDSSLIEKIRGLDLNEMKPIDALNFLQNLKESVENKD